MLGKEAARWLHIGRNATHFAAGGFITEPIYGVGASRRTYTFGERGVETVIPGRHGGRGQVSIGRVYVRNETDLGLMAQKLSFACSSQTLIA